MPEETSTALGSGSLEEKPCSSTAAVADSSVDVMEEAKKLIGTGNRHLVMGDVVSAVNAFQDACGKLAAKYGETADECGEAFYLCGKSLLELARMENGVLGNALDGVPEDSEEEEPPKNPNIESADNLDEKTREELRKQVYDAMAVEETIQKVVSKMEGNDAACDVKVESGFKVPNQHDAAGLENQSGSPESKEVKNSITNAEVAAPEADKDASVQDAHKESVGENMEDKKAEENEESSPEAQQDKDESDDDDDDDDDDEDDGENEAGNDQAKDEDDVGNLQLAWEMLEVAKVIYKRKESKEDQLMAAQAYLSLGEVSAESGNYPQALEDFQECLSLQLKHLPPHSRLLAETHYHVATTLCYMDQYSQAIQHYSSSIKVIETRLAMLQEVISAAEGDAAKEKTEMEELQMLLPDIKERVEDAKESQRTATTASQAIQQTLGGASTSTFLCENGGASSSSSSTIGFQITTQIPVKSSESSSSSPKVASDISHLVRKKRKPEEESPVEDKDAKKARQETTINGSADSSANNSNKVQEGKSQEPEAQPSTTESSS